VSESFLDGKVILHRGDCLEVLPLLEENSIDSCVTDPPYHLISIVKRFGKENSAPINNRDEQEGRQGPYHRASKGFMGKQWDGGDVAFRPETWAEVLRVLKPGAHLIAFSGTRTYHRMACAIEDAGFEIRDQIGWCYGSGFPKSHNVAQSIEKHITTGKSRRPDRDLGGLSRNRFSGDIEGGLIANTGGHIPLTRAEAIQFEGWGTALKPAWEPCVLARKPLSESSIAANVLKHGTGGINVDGCRVGIDDVSDPSRQQRQQSNRVTWEGGEQSRFKADHVQPLYSAKGRWPANLILDGSEEVLAGFPELKGGSPTGPRERKRKAHKLDECIGYSNAPEFYDGDGSAARFFYTAKADADDRLGSKHPTVKPIDLIQYLCRLVTPLGGNCLDPFAGTGTLGEAAFREGFQAILIEREEEYQADIVKRMGLCLSGPEERRAASVKQLPPDDLPMFGGGI
jgi:DNA modification methylase